MGLSGSKPQQQPSIMLGPSTPPPSTASSTMKIVGYVLGGIVIVLVGVVVYNMIQRQQGLPTLSVGSTTSSSGDKIPSSADGSKKLVIPSGEVPVGAGSDYGLQFWMFIKDWDYKFGQEKQIVKRISPTGTDVNPFITLHPTDNSLQVRVSIYPQSPGSGTAAVPTASSTGDSFTCTVENVPLQSWFSVSVTVFQRNLDIYINGRLVKSCVLPGIPKPVVGDIVVGDNGGFSGTICNLNSYPSMLGPEDARSFFTAGTRCQPPSGTKTQAVDPNSTFITLFGYTFRFSTLDKAGKELSSYTF